MTKDELRKGIMEAFSSIVERTLFWRYIGQLEKRIAELEEPILCHKCNDHIDGDGAICGVCASTQDIVNNEQRERIAELESENKYLGNMPIMKVKAPEAVIYENALSANRELAITVNTQQNRIKELEAKLAEKETNNEHLPQD